MPARYKWQKPKSQADLLGIEKRRESRDVGQSPIAQPPPYLVPVSSQGDDSAINWQDTCKGAIGHRCGFCPLCEWERDVAKWLELEPWTKQNRLILSDDQPVWPSVHAAIRALVEYELSGRASPSALGPILDNLRQGAIRIRRAGTTYRRDREDPLISRANKINEVAISLSRAYSNDNRWGLETSECVIMLLACTDGVLKKTPTAKELERHIGLDSDTIKSVVKDGRKKMTVELAARGLIQMPNRYKGLACDIDDYKKNRGWK
jgi:hypothetical protein